MSDGVFISYRRSDSSAFAGRLFDYLQWKYPRSAVFMDVDGLAPGVDFAAELRTRVASSAVVLVVIGPDWLDTRDDAGQRRLDDPDDFVRIEVEHALAQGVRLVPVLLDDTPMPPAGDLPKSLRPLTRFNAVSLRHARFRDDASVLARFLAPLIGTGRRRRWPIWAALGGVTAAGVVAAVLLWPPGIACTRIANPGDVEGVAPGAISVYLENPRSGDFLVLSAKGRKEFVQFIFVGDGLLLDLPKQNMTDAQRARADAFFARVVQRPGVRENGRNREDKTYQLDIDPERSVVLGLVRDVFSDIFCFNGIPAVQARRGN